MLFAITFVFWCSYFRHSRENGVRRQVCWSQIVSLLFGGLCCFVAFIKWWFTICTGALCSWAQSGLDRNGQPWKMDCPPQVGNNFLPQMEEFNITTPAHQKEPTAVVLTSDQDNYWICPWWDASGMWTGRDPRSFSLVSHTFSIWATLQ